MCVVSDQTKHKEEAIHLLTLNNNCNPEYGLQVSFVLMVKNAHLSIQRKCHLVTDQLFLTCTLKKFLPCIVLYNIMDPYRYIMFRMLSWGRPDAIVRGSICALWGTCLAPWTNHATTKAWLGSLKTARWRRCSWSFGRRRNDLRWEVGNFDTFG